MSNSPNIPHVNYQPIRTYGYDVIVIWLFVYDVLFCFHQNLYNFQHIISQRFFGHSQFIYSIMKYNY